MDPIDVDEAELLGTYPVLAWEPSPDTSFDDYPEAMQSC